MSAKPLVLFLKLFYGFMPIDFKRKKLLIAQNVLLQQAGMLTGDFVIGVNDVDVKWSKHDEVVELVKASGSKIRVCVITPIDQDFLHGTTKTTPNSKTDNPKADKEADKKKEKTSSIWTLKRRSRSRDKKTGKIVANGNTKTVGAK